MTERRPLWKPSQKSCKIWVRNQLVQQILYFLQFCEELFSEAVYGKWNNQVCLLVTRFSTMGTWVFVIESCISVHNFLLWRRLNSAKWSGRFRWIFWEVGRVSISLSSTHPLLPPILQYALHIMKQLCMFWNELRKEAPKLHTNHSIKYITWFLASKCICLISVHIWVLPFLFISCTCGLLKHILKTQVCNAGIVWNRFINYIASLLNAPAENKKRKEDTFGNLFCLSWSMLKKVFKSCATRNIHQVIFK